MELKPAFPGSIGSLVTADPDDVGRVTDDQLRGVHADEHDLGR
ncbi:MAG: hypothetical protein ACM34E_07820 [Acidobacteriota bacterium]